MPDSSVGIIGVFVIGDFPDGRTLCWELRMKNEELRMSLGVNRVQPLLEIYT